MEPAVVIFFLLFISVGLFLSILIVGKMNQSLKQEILDSRKKVSELEERYTDVTDTEEECARIRAEHEFELEEIRGEKIAIEEAKFRAAKSIAGLEKDYKKKRGVYDSLVKQIAIFSDDVELLELGFYEPRFDFDASETFKSEIKKCKEAQKALMRDKTESGAIFCMTEWTVGNSRTEGRKMTDRGIRLTARAFNNECEAAVANCTWKNVKKMEERIVKAFDAINKLNASNSIIISSRYLEEKLKELQLTHEYREKRQREKVEQDEIKQQMREEAKAEAEIKKAEAEAIKEEKRYQKALQEARRELEKANGDDKSLLEEKIAQLQSDLEEAERKHQRMQSMAEKTRQGHVYIISNLGSFGENVYKIGMTRRLEPMDRVKELGDASVPFTFDVHAMIHTQDAPELEKKLHEKFDSRRLNMVNRRKEFFDVSLGEIREAVGDLLGDEVDFVETAMAQDYFETQTMKKQALIKEGKIKLDAKADHVKFPEFADSL